MLTKILMATDGSDSSQNALEYSLSFLPRDVELIILTVMPEVKKEFEISLKPSYEQIVNDAESYAKKNRPDLSVKKIVEEGFPADLICHYAHSENADMVIMGSRGIGGVKGFLLGSVSRNVVNACMKPVLIVK